MKIKTMSTGKEEQSTQERGGEGEGEKEAKLLREIQEVKGIKNGARRTVRKCKKGRKKQLERVRTRGIKS
ncbi:unnamed protein product [Gadus morhua 'NCC']